MLTWQHGREDPSATPHWDPEVLARVDKAITAISVITLAEIRYGHRKADWGAKRIAEAEQSLEAYLRIPLDALVIEEWARLKNITRREGLTCGDNDLWIAATASTPRGYPLVTCDEDHDRIEDAALDVIYLPVAPRRMSRADSPACLRSPQSRDRCRHKSEPSPPQ